MALQKLKNPLRFEVLKIFYRKPISKNDRYDKDEYSPSEQLPKSLIPELTQYAATLPFSYTGFINIHFTYDDVDYTVQYGTFDQWSAHKRLIKSGEKAQFKLGNRSWFGHCQVVEVDYTPKARTPKNRTYYEPADYVDYDEFSEEQFHRDFVMDCLD